MNSLRDEFDTFRTSRKAIQRRRERKTIFRKLSSRVPDSLHPDERRLPFFSRMYEDLVSTEQEWNDWFASFKRQHRRGHFDAIVVQETHTKANELNEITRSYAAHWGYRAGPNCPSLSYWASLDRGLGILLHPRSRFQTVKPYVQEKWSIQFMALQGSYNGQMVIFLNVYTPVVKKD